MAESKNVDLIPERDAQVFHVSQGDNDRKIRCNIIDGMNPYSIGLNTSLVLRAKKSNGTKCQVVLTRTSASYVDIPVPSSLTDTAGYVYCKLRIGNLGCKSFYLYVEAF